MITGLGPKYSHSCLRATKYTLGIMVSLGGLLPRSHPSSGGQNWCPICHSQPKSIQRGYQFWIRGLHDQAALWASATWSTDMYCNVHASVEIVSLMLCPSGKDKSVIRHYFPGWVRCNESCTSFSEQAHIWRSSYLAHPQNQLLSFSTFIPDHCVYWYYCTKQDGDF